MGIRPMTRLHGDRRFYRRMRIVADEVEIFEFEVVNFFDRRIQFHAWQRSTITRKLFACLIEMILIQMQIAERMNEFARL